MACPACRALVHGARLRELAAAAGALAHRGDLTRARDTWDEALSLLPAGTKQHTVISERVAELTRRIGSVKSDTPKADPSHPWWRRGAAAAIAIAVLLLGKLKFLLLGLAKAKTLFSMVAFFGVYWTTYGWPLALGLVVSIYIHEMGHVAMLRRLGIEAGAPLFIPGVGALVLLKRHIDDPIADARVGLAGPIWGLGAGLAALGAYVVTDASIWLAIAQLTGFINLFNLIPVWQLDGSRGFHALTSAQRWAAVAAIAVAFMLTGQKLLVIVGLVAGFRAFQRTDVKGDSTTLATFAGLVFALSWLARAVR
jgi:Zn-dependent protease